MKSLIRVFCCIFLFTVGSYTIAAEKNNKLLNTEASGSLKRVALIIGNANYKGSSKLTNPLVDATEMCEALRLLSFEVICKTDIASKREFKDAIFEFTEKIDSKTVSLFFYAGHGIESNHINYLLPTQAILKTKSDIDDEAVPVNYLVSELNIRRAMLNIILLDACRNNPLPAPIRGYTQTIGFANQEVLPDNGVVLLSTKPGKVALDGFGKNSVFTRNILKSISVPKLAINDLFLRVMAGTSKDAKTMGSEQQPELRQTFNEKFCLTACDDGKLTSTANEEQSVQLKLKQKEFEQLQLNISSAKAEQKEIDSQKDVMLRKQKQIEEIKNSLEASKFEQTALEQQKIVIQQKRLEIEAQKNELILRQNEIEKIRDSLVGTKSEQVTLENQKHSLQQKQKEVDNQKAILQKDQKENERMKESIAGNKAEQNKLERQHADLLSKQKEIEGLTQEISKVSSNLKRMQDEKKQLLEKQVELDKLKQTLARQEMAIKEKETLMQQELNSSKKKQNSDSVIIPNF